ncbi:MAG: KH domain-containing protein [Ignavibacteriales bacterium]
MKMVELTEFLVKSLVKDPDMVSVKQFDDEDDTMIIQVLVNEDEMGAIIGKGGNIANSIRTIVQASAYTNGEKKVRINIDSF